MLCCCAAVLCGAVMCGRAQSSSSPKLQRKRQQILAAPFLLMMQCQARTEMHITEFFVTPQPRRQNEATRVYRVCKVHEVVMKQLYDWCSHNTNWQQVDCGHNVAQADNLWNIDSAVDVLEQVMEDIEYAACCSLAPPPLCFDLRHARVWLCLFSSRSEGGYGISKLGFASASSVADVEHKLRLAQVKEAIHMGQMLSQTCVLEAMRDVGALFVGALSLTVAAPRSRCVFQRVPGCWPNVVFKCQDCWCGRGVAWYRGTPGRTTSC